eukprot:TRINITY_DN55230_c0_g1_i1.p1 TRINITY_DN55230_c0_g1~~TRINITY_DN55230_c0_g1_i1.p1  ORF type:complete len:291 (-),score=37.83 TRINITY_DN55230_c0_g1_i1:217-1089(-)
MTPEQESSSASVSVESSVPLTDGVSPLRKWCAVSLLIGLLLLCAILDSVYGLHERALKFVFSLLGFFSSKSLQACMIYILVYVVVCLVCVPLTPFEIFTGFCFGIPFGIVLDIIGRVMGSVLSFMIARTLWKHGSGCPCIRGEAVLRGVGKSVEERGFRFLILFNLAYVPVAVKNYGLGLVPNVPLHLFVLAILVVEVPMATIWASIGSAAAAELGVNATNSSAAEEAIAHGHAHGGFWLKAFLLLIGVGSILFVLRIVHQKVSIELAREDEGEDRERSLLDQPTVRSEA